MLQVDWKMVLERSYRKIIQQELCRMFFTKDNHGRGGYQSHVRGAEIKTLINGFKIELHDIVHMVKVGNFKMCYSDI